MIDKTCYTCNIRDTCEKTPARKTCSGWVGDSDIYKCKCGATDFEIQLNCNFNDMDGDTAFHSIRCSVCGEDIYTFDEVE